MTIAEIRNAMKRRELTVNHDYQRSPEVWPQSAKSYFIDTILSGFPFPKIYVYAHYGDSNAAEETLKEIVDGQQRVTTMMEYLNNKFAISTASSKFKARRYRDLDQEAKQRYLNTQVEIDLILQAEPTQILEMFRRINSYTAPLRPAEKRHAAYTGKFKWFVNETADEYSPVLNSYGVLTAKQIVRMADAEFITELAQVLDVGIIDKSNSALERIYKNYDIKFSHENEFRKKLDEFFELMTTTLKPLVESPLMKTYNLYSLFCALVGRKYGFPGSHDLGIRKRGTFFKSQKAGVARLKELSQALLENADDGEFADYLEVSHEQTTRKSTRIPRAKLLAKYLDA